MARLIRGSSVLVVAFAVLLASAPAHAQARTEIHWWHAMTGQLNDALVTLAKQFNESQAEYEVKPLNKGTYPEAELRTALAQVRIKATARAETLSLKESAELFRALRNAQAQS